MSEYNKIGSYICDDHFNSLKKETEEFSMSPFPMSNCDFCDETATHWISHIVSKFDFGEYNCLLRYRFFHKLEKMIEMLKNFSNQNSLMDGLYEKEERELMSLVRDVDRLRKEQ